MPPKETLWMLLDCTGSQDTDPVSGAVVTTISMVFASNGELYCIAVTGPERLSNIEFIDACRAAGAKMITASGGDPAMLAAREAAPGEVIAPSPGLVQ